MSKGEVKAISQKNRSVLMIEKDIYGSNPTESWLRLGENIKMNWVKKGSCEFKQKDGLISFIKCSEEQKNDFKTADKFKENYSDSLKYKHASVMMSYAKDLAVADKIKVKEITDYSIKFMKLLDELVVVEEKAIKEESKNEQDIS
ncbi:MAG: hypothetical protein ACTSUC_09705 [Promethearchaeota archaeon]